MRLLALGLLLFTSSFSGAYGQSGATGENILNTHTYTPTCKWENLSFDMCMMAVMDAAGVLTDEAKKISLERDREAVSSKQCVKADTIVAQAVGAIAGVKTVQALRSGTLQTDTEKIRSYCLQAAYEYEFKRCPGAGPSHCSR